MTTFHNGPAAGQVMDLGRAPFLLRVTQDGRRFDALDQPDDEPEPGERLHAYFLVEGPTACFVRAQRPKRSGLYIMAAYRAVPAQPRDEDMRTRARWVAWCEANAAALGWRPPEAKP